jgi:TPR repeat protein
MFRQPVAQLVVIVLSVFGGAPVVAGPLEDASAAAKLGDYATALPLFRTLANQGNTYAQYSLGIMYARGQGVPQDYAEGVKWIRLAAEKGLVIAQTDLAIMFRRGLGVARDGAEAATWFRRAADQDSVVAQSSLGDMYAMGDGVTQDYAEAFKWYGRAAEQDFSYAQNMLGVAYEHGFFVQQSYADALAWYRRAANNVSDSSRLTLMHGPHYNLAAMYASGHGVPRDNVQAYMWFTLAARFGDVNSPDGRGVALFGASKETALEQRDRIAALMTSKQIAEGERLAREWTPRVILTVRPQAK